MVLKESNTSLISKNSDSNILHKFIEKSIEEDGESAMINDVIKEDWL